MFFQWIFQTSLAKALEKLVKPICELCLGVLPCFGRNFLPLLALECWDDDSCSWGQLSKICSLIKRLTGDANKGALNKAKDAICLLPILLF